MFELFNNVSVEEDTTLCLLKPPQQYASSAQKPPKELKTLAANYDVSKCYNYVKQFHWITKHCNIFRAFNEESSVSTLCFMIEIVKKAWFFGQINNSEFSRFVGVLKNLHYLRVFPYIIGCFRLKNLEEITPEGYNPLVELCTVVLNQAALQCDVFVPTEMLTYAETYFVATKQGRVYLLDKLKTSKIFSQKDFWECHLLYSVNRQAKGQDHFTRKSVGLGTLKQIAQDSVGSVIRSAILTMARAGLDKHIAQDIILSTIDKFKLDDQNRSLALAFLKEYQAEKPTIPKDAKLEFSIEESQFA